MVLSSKLEKNFRGLIDGRVLGLLTIVYLLGIIFPPFVASRVEAYCDDQSRQTANEVIQAIDRYTKTEQKFPDQLGDLLPTYLKTISLPNCFSLYSVFSPVLTDQIEWA